MAMSVPLLLSQYFPQAETALAEIISTFVEAFPRLTDFFNYMQTAWFGNVRLTSLYNVAHVTNNAAENFNRRIGQRMRRYDEHRSFWNFLGDCMFLFKICIKHFLLH